MTPAPRLAVVSVDLDEIDCYAAIHGLSPALARGHARHAIYDRALPRLVDLFSQLGIPATFFAIGKDLSERPENAKAVRQLVQAGHEVANHSHGHHYDLTRLDLPQQRREIREGADAIEHATGLRPVGFRAPGYTIDDPLFEILQEQGYLYDSSVFPCPAYYAPKALALAWIRARGRRSHSILDDPRVLTAPADPYRVGRPYWKRGQGLVELPVGVTRGHWGRLPFIGTSLVLAGSRGARWLAAAMRGRPVVSLELHGIDLADEREDDLAWLLPHQPDLRRSAKQKQAALLTALGVLKEAGYRFVTCTTAARALAASLPVPA